ncbi:hypothetical protein WA026_004554 [Henosepilachna vigintioctopunctata]|uniref:Uncharacterized protein n=1 Tax=Henosepilachna vigintioctopunctata TaxID=420089 RepID=A0AAW1V6X8_9CUCU
MINETLRKTIDELNTQREYTEAHVSALKEEVCTLRQDNEALMERILNLDKENNSMKMIIENYVEEFRKMEDKLYSRLYERIRSNILNELKERQCSQPCFGGAPNQCSQEKDGISISEMRQKAVKAIIHNGRDKRGQIKSDLDVAISRGAGSSSVVKGSYAQMACSESKGKPNKLITVSGGGSKPGVYTGSSYGANRMLRGTPCKKKSSNGLLNGESVLKKHFKVAMNGAENVQPGELLEGRSPCDTPALLQAEQWNSVSSKKQKSKSLVGTGGGCNILIKGVKQLCHTHICKLSPDLTVENIIHHLNKNNLDGVRCVKLSSKRPDEYSSFRATAGAAFGGVAADIDDFLPQNEHKPPCVVDQLQRLEPDYRGKFSTSVMSHGSEARLHSDCCK